MAAVLAYLSSVPPFQDLGFLGLGCLSNSMMSPTFFFFFFPLLHQATLMILSESVGL